MVRGSLILSKVNCSRVVSWPFIKLEVLVACLIPLLPFMVKALKDPWIVLSPEEAEEMKRCSLVIAPNLLVIRSTEAGM